MTCKRITEGASGSTSAVGIAVVTGNSCFKGPELGKNEHIGKLQRRLNGAEGYTQWRRQRPN